MERKREISSGRVWSPLGRREGSYFGRGFLNGFSVTRHVMGGGRGLRTEGGSHRNFVPVTVISGVSRCLGVVDHPSSSQTYL